MINNLIFLNHFYTIQAQVLCEDLWSFFFFFLQLISNLKSLNDSFAWWHSQLQMKINVSCSLFTNRAKCVLFFLFFILYCCYFPAAFTTVTLTGACLSYAFRVPSCFFSFLCELLGLPSKDLQQRVYSSWVSTNDRQLSLKLEDIRKNLSESPVQLWYGTASSG